MIKLELKTIGDLVAVIQNTALSCNAELAQHMTTLLGPRTRGSTTTTWGLESLDPLIPLEEYTLGNVAAVEGCRYFQFRTTGDKVGRLGAIMRDAALGRPEPVCVRKGKHVYELFLDKPADESAMPEVQYYTVITGPFKGCDSEVVWTWHPGNPLATATILTFHIPKRVLGRIGSGIKRRKD